MKVNRPLFARLAQTLMNRTAIVRSILILFCLAALGGGAYLSAARMVQDPETLRTQSASASPEGIWRRVTNISTNSDRTVQLNEDALGAVLRQAPMEFTTTTNQSPVVITLPMRDGSFARFSIAESPIMEPELAAKFPNIKTYSGQGIEDPAATTRFDWTPSGFHAIVLSAGGETYIEPDGKGDPGMYLVHTPADLQKGSGFHCAVLDVDEAIRGESEKVAQKIVSGSTLRTYRLAVGVTGDYVQAYGGGTVSGGLDAVTTAVNSFNAFFEKEVAIRLVLISNEDSIIFTDPLTDPYTHGNKNTLLTENQTLLDSVIGTSKYDIGFAFDNFTAGLDGGGVASLAVVCRDGRKARGVAIFSSSPSSPRTVRLMVHEIGHQFGANHTYNGTTGQCTQRRADSAYEPGSGSTIMSYTGLCDTENIPSTFFYHSKSLEAIIALSTTGSAGGACPGQITTSNNPPDLASGANFTIPKSTPFTLTATGSDVDGDSLTYSWEEFDLGAQAPPNTDADGQERPILRVFSPVISPSRTFPRLSDILSNTTTFGESLPTITRTMNLKVTARDNRAGGGGVATADMKVNVTAGAGPFAVTQPNTASTWTGGSKETVTWSVSNTDLPPVSCSNVKISLSIDGGNTFPQVLAASTSNDGTEAITVPNDVVSTRCRVKVEAVDNIFFDISETNFNVTPSGTCPVVGSISQSIGNVGNTVTITGANFTGVAAVKFANSVNASFTVNSSTLITTTVPAAAVTGPITISKSNCSDTETAFFTVSGSPPVDLSADNNPGSFGCLAIGGVQPYYVNRLTPSGYPATLASVSIYFPNCGLKVGSSLDIVVGLNTDGDSNINNTVFQVTPVTVQALNKFNSYSVPNLSIKSGDFVVGFRIASASNLFPAPYNRSVPSQGRAFMSYDDGSTFDLLDNIFPNFPGNFGIRARVYSGAVNCPTVTSINPTAAPPGANVTMIGTNLSGISKVKFSSSVTASFNIVSHSQITATVPVRGAVSGPITLGKSGCSDIQTGSFTVSGANPSFQITMSKTTYVDGDTVTATEFRPQNPNSTATPVKLRLWIKVPTVGEIDLVNIGADGSFSLPPNLDVNAGPLSLIAITSSFPPKGNWEFNARVTDPKTGAIYSEDINPFIIQ